MALARTRKIRVTLRLYDLKSIVTGGVSARHVNKARVTNTVEFRNVVLVSAL